MTETFLSQVAQITPNLYLSSFVGTSEQSIIKYGITCVITVCKEVPKINLNYVESIKIDLLDRPTEQIERYFDYVADKINEVVQRKGICLVHCVAGISRSATMILVYLMKYHKMNLKEAHTLVKSKRPFIRPNLGFWKQLIDYEKKLFSSNSVNLITTTFGLVPDIYEKELQNMFGLDLNDTKKLSFNKFTTPATLRHSSLVLNIPSTKNEQFKHQQQQQQQQTHSNAYHPFQFPNKNSLNTNRSSSYYTTTYNSSYGNSISTNKKDNNM